MALAAVCDEVVVVCRNGQALPPLELAVPARVAFDAVEGLGPLAGLVAGLEAAASEACFVSSCDAPRLRPAVVSLLLARLPGNAAALPFADGRAQPLAAAYDRSAALGHLRHSLDAGVRRLRDAVLALGPLIVTEAEVRAVDPDLSSFANVNDSAELASLAARLKAT